MFGERLLAKQGKAIMLTPILETERILLRPLKVSDAKAVFSGWSADDDVTKYLPWSTHQTIDDTIEWLTFEEAGVASDKRYQWALTNKTNRELFGSGGFIYNDEQGMLDLGYVIMKSYWHQGFVTEAAKAMIDFAVNELGQTKIFAKHAKENSASGKVLEKLGFSYINDGLYKSLDGNEISESCEYILITAK